MSKPTKKKPGRPKGSQTAKRDHVLGELTRCRACGSTDREPYSQTHVTAYSAIHPQTGKPYTHIVRRWTACSACGQARIDYYYENRK